MSLATLSDVLQPALKGGYAIGGLVTIGWEEMRAYVAAAEAENVPVILQAGPDCRELRWLTVAPPGQATGAAQTVQPGGVVYTHAGRKYLTLPGRRGRRHAIQPLYCALHDGLRNRC